MSSLNVRSLSSLKCHRAAGVRVAVCVAMCPAVMIADYGQLAGPLVRSVSSLNAGKEPVCVAACVAVRVCTCVAVCIAMCRVCSINVW